MTQEEKIKQFIDGEIERHEDINNILRDIHLNDYAIIEYTFKSNYKDTPYWHKGIYQLCWNLKDGLFFTIVALKLEEHPVYGLTQWRLHGKIPMNKLYQWSDGTIHVNIEEFSATIIAITKTDKEDIFNNTELSYPFTMSALDKIKSKGIEVPQVLYPIDSNQSYDIQKTYDFIKLNLSEL